MHRNPAILKVVAACLTLATPALANTLTDTTTRDVNAALPLTARDEMPLWQNAPLSSRLTPVPQGEAMKRLTEQTPLLSLLRDWRETIRGSNVASQRDFQLAEVQDVELALHIGARPLPASTMAGLGGIVSGTALSFGRITVGSTAPSTALNQLLQPYDEFMKSAARTPLKSDESRLTWLTARPLDSAVGKIDMMLVRGRRDLSPGQPTEKLFTEGTLWGARGEFDPLPQWKLNGERISSQLNSQEEGASAWQIALAGPVRHPWGEAKASANYSDVAPGFAAFTGITSKEGQRSGRVAVQQEIKMGDLNGAATVTMLQTGRQDIAQLPPGAEIESDVVEGTAQLRWKLSPFMALTTKHTHRSNVRRLEDNTLDSENFVRDSTQYSTSDIGLEWQLSRSLAVALATGQTRIGTNVSELDADGEILLWRPAVMRDEDRLSLDLQRKTSGGMWKVQVAHKSLANTVAGADSSESEQEMKDVRLEAERRLFPWLRVKGSLLLSGKEDFVQHLEDGRAQRSAEAQLSLPRLGRFALRYTDWDQYRNTQESYESLAETREYGIRYNLGVSGNQAGLGLAIEYSLRESRAASDLATWRVGVTYR